MLSSARPGVLAERALLEGDDDVRSQFGALNAACKTGNASAVADLFAEDGVLLARTSNKASHAAD